MGSGRAAALAALLLLGVAAGTARQLRDHYAVLGVARTARDGDIRAAYKRLARRWHPDQNRDPTASERFMDISSAYKVLSDPIERSIFDSRLARQGPPRFSFRGGSYGAAGGAGAGGGRPSRRLRDRDAALLFPSNFSTYVLVPKVRVVLFHSGTNSISADTWRRTVAHYGPLGVGFALVNCSRTGELCAEWQVEGMGLFAFHDGFLNRHPWPQMFSIAAVNTLVAEVIPLAFRSKLVPGAVSGFLEEDAQRVKCLVLDDGTLGTAPFSLLAMQFHSHIDLAFVDLSPQAEVAAGAGASTGSGGGSGSAAAAAAAATRQRFTVRALPSLLVFKEDRAVPAERLEGGQLDAGAARALLGAHRHLHVPRLDSAEIFADKCACRAGDERGCPRLCVLVFCAGAERQYPAGTLGQRLLGHLVKAVARRALHPAGAAVLTVNAPAQPHLSRAVGLPYQSSGPTMLAVCVMRTGPTAAHALYPMLLNATADGPRALSDLAAVLAWLQRDTLPYATTGRYEVLEEHRPLLARLRGHALSLFSEARELVRRTDDLLLFALLVLVLLIAMYVMEALLDSPRPPARTPRKRQAGQAQGQGQATPRATTGLGEVARSSPFWSPGTATRRRLRAQAGSAAKKGSSGSTTATPRRLRQAGAAGAEGRGGEPRLLLTDDGRPLVFR